MIQVGFEADPVDVFWPLPTLSEWGGNRIDLPQETAKISWKWAAKLWLSPTRGDSNRECVHRSVSYRADGCHCPNITNGTQQVRTTMADGNLYHVERCFRKLFWTIQNLKKKNVWNQTIISPYSYGIPMDSKPPLSACLSVPAGGFGGAPTFCSSFTSEKVMGGAEVIR